MAYIIQDDIMGLPMITATDTTPRAPAGMIAHAVDQDGLGGGEFLYLEGAAGTVAGSVVTYDQMNNTTTLGGSPSSGAPVAVAMAANVASRWGWYQVTGNALVLKDGTALVAGGPVGLGTVAGTLGAVVATHQLIGARVINAAATGAATANVQISRPAIAQS